MITSAYQAGNGTPFFASRRRFITRPVSLMHASLVGILFSVPVSGPFSPTHCIILRLCIFYRGVFPLHYFPHTIQVTHTLSCIRQGVNGRTAAESCILWQPFLYQLLLFSVHLFFMFLFFFSLSRFPLYWIMSRGSNVS